MKLTKKLLTCLTFVIFLSCGLEESRLKLDVDAELTHHVSNFIDKIRENKVSFPYKNYKELKSVKISNHTESKDYGICIIEENENRLANSVRVEASTTRKIIIYNEKIKNDFPENYSQMVKLITYHELIHCLLEKEHDHGINGIMTTNVSDLLFLYPLSIEQLIRKSLTPNYIDTLDFIDK